MKTTFKLVHDKDWDEYRVEVRVDGKLQKSRTYYTDDRDDAIATKKQMIIESNN
jgi:hypothetical protein